MRFAKMGLERDPCFMYQRMTVPVFDVFTEISSRVDNVVCL